MKFEVLYPELTGLYGDAMNAELMKRAIPEMEQIGTRLGMQPEFTKGGADIVYIGSMTERSQARVSDALREYREDIEREIERGTVFIATGNGIEIFGKGVELDDGSKIEGLGVFGYHAKGQMLKRYNGMYLGIFEGIEIVGYKSQFTHMYGGESEEGLFETLRGAGRSPGDKAEGIRRNNFYGTYLLGPLLVMNPKLLKHIMEQLGYVGRETPYERAAMAAYEARLKEFRDPRTIETF